MQLSKLDAIIKASAQLPNSQTCSCGAGGLIRLKALQVDLRKQGKLIVDGGKRGSGAATSLGGGAGGIIQIISPAGRLLPKALSLKGGPMYGTCSEAEHGYYFIADYSKPANVEIYPTNPYNWSSNSSQSSPLPCFSVTPTHQNPVENLMRRLKAIYNLLTRGGKLNKSAILEYLATLKLLLSRNTSPKDLEDLCLNIYENYTVIEFEIAKRDPLFAVVSLQGILNATSECIEKSHYFRRQNHQIPNLMEAVEDVLIAAVNGTSSLEISYTVTSSNIVAQVERNLVKAVIEDIKIPRYSKALGDSWNKESDYALIPKETLKDGKGVWLLPCCQ